MHLNIVIPCYNEETALANTCQHLQILLKELVSEGKIEQKSTIYLVDDGSTDACWEVICELSDNNENIQGIKLAHHQGQQNALLAGLFSVTGDVVISLDADMQDDIQIIPEMINEYQQGVEIVYAVRKKRQSDSWLKQKSAAWFYRIMKLMGVELINEHADYRLLSCKVIEQLKGFREVNLFLRGLIPMLGFKSSIVFYERQPRIAGDSKYSYLKMLALAWNGMTSFSIVPIRLIALIGFIIFIASLGLSIWGLFIRLFTDQAIPGWASTVLPIYFIGGIQLLSLGIIGEYIGKIYLETKQRPRYIVEKRTDIDN